MKMRAKMVVTSESFGGDETVGGSYNTIGFNAVSKSDGYPEDGSDENNTFARFTPSANLEMTITNPDLIGKFKLGQEFYVDFSEVEQAG